MKIKRRHVEPGVPAVAMADIAFNLVLFFIILAKTQDTSSLKWDPAKTRVVERNEHSRIIVTVTKEYKVYLNTDEVGITELTPKIKDLLDRDATGRKTVLLRIHRDTPAATFEPIIEAVSLAGGQVVHVLDKEEPDKP